ncbi:MAG TPA: hypothetical protein VGG40_11290 [Solirubrobacterales bacterium]|jgi:photosystem II stability/assembly factor-like uncharacterized protein
MIRRLAALVLCALPLLVTPPASAHPERPRDFLEDALVSGASGWARTYRGVYWTDDGGASWRNITPAIEHPATLQAVDFADPEHGWAVAEEGDEPHPGAALFATQNGGRSWTRARIHFGSRYSQVGSASFAAVGAHRVYALVRESRNTAFSVGYLFASRDGGRHWHQLPERPPHAGEIVFSSSRDGWLAEEGPSPALYRTRDSGRSWQEVRLPRPPGLAKARTDYLAPRFEADGHGILAATYDNFEKRAFTVLYTSEDSGRHWTLAASTRLLVEGDPVVFAYRGEDSVVTAIYEAPQLGLLNIDGSTPSLAGTGLPVEYSPWLSFSGSEDGLARIDAEDCTVKQRSAHCTEVNGLYFSADGGASWAPTTRP